jgi:hypothetical protein
VFGCRVLARTPSPVFVESIHNNIYFDYCYYNWREINGCHLQWTAGLPSRQYQHAGNCHVCQWRRTEEDPVCTEATYFKMEMPRFIGNPLSATQVLGHFQLAGDEHSNRFLKRPCAGSIYQYLNSHSDQTGNYNINVDINA